MTIVKATATLFTTTLLALALAACSQAPTKPLKLTNPPAWYLTPPADTAMDLYGAGAAKSREKAVQAALNDLASKLGVQVSSQFELQHKSTNSAYAFDEETSDQKILTEVQTTTLNQYQVMKTQQTGYDRFYALVKTNKNALAFSIRKNLEQQVESFLRAEKSARATYQPGYQLWLFYDKQHSNLPAFNRQLAILQTLKKRENTKLYTDYLNDVKQKFKAEKASTKFLIDSSSAQAKQLETTLENLITTSGFALVDNKAKATDIIKLTASEKTTQAYGFTIIRSQAQLALHENKELQGSNNFALKGQGMNKAQAEINLQKDFKDQLQKLSLPRALGISTK